MTAAKVLLLVVAGVCSGLTGSIAGLASLVSYPVLLAIGLPPVTANVTNTVALVCSSIGSTIGSQPELRGQSARLRQLGASAIVGGAVGGGLLLLTPSGTFEVLVPFLIAFASAAILVRRRIVDDVHPHEPHTTHTHGELDPALMLGVAAVAVYGGYFGAGAGVMMLALLLFVTAEPLPRANAVKNVVLGLANGVAAVSFAFFGPVDWAVAVPLGAGLFIGGRLGPGVVRRTPSDRLRVVIALAGFGLAITLAIGAFRG